MPGLAFPNYTFPDQLKCQVWFYSDALACQTCRRRGSVPFWINHCQPPRWRRTLYCHCVSLRNNAAERNALAPQLQKHTLKLLVLCFTYSPLEFENLQWIQFLLDPVKHLALNQLCICSWKHWCRWSFMFCDRSQDLANRYKYPSWLTLKTHQPVSHVPCDSPSQVIIDQRFHWHLWLCFTHGLEECMEVRSDIYDDAAVRVPDTRWCGKSW